jgi:mono/diheme cytochrome c family protein
MFRPSLRHFVAVLSAVPLFARAGENKVLFNRDIRPIFSDTCFQCHGPDEAKRKAGLRLDTRETAVKPAESGATAIVPGKPEESELVKRLLATDPDDVMPPAKLHKTIKPAQIETIKRWIAEGAEYQGHWAFIPPTRPAVPGSGGFPAAGGDRNVAPPSNPIDAFIRARLAKEGLTPAPEADRPTLIRRVSLDLTGIPPTPQEVDAFLADKSPNAYEKVVDRLIASPRYGERMAVQWLDFARYADSNGFQSDTSRTMWHWRDWVINAFNRNLPFDRFTIEQLAGDLLPNPAREQIVATGFNRNHRLNGEGGRIVEEWFAENVIDRVDTTGSTWLGLTLGCARCHDHKFDPVSQKEFYQLFAFFNSNDENGVLDEFGGSGPTRGGGNSRPILTLPTPEQEAQQAKLEAAVTATEQRVAEAQKQLPKLQKEWETKFSTQLDQQAEPWQPLAPTEVKSEGGATFTRLEDGSWLASGKNPANDTYTITAPIPAGELTGLRIEALPDDSLPNKSLGRSSNGNFVLSGVEVEITASSLPQHVSVDFAKAEADYEQKGYEVKAIVDENVKKGKGAKAKKGWAIDGNDPAKRLPRKAMFVAATPVAVPADATVIVRLKHEASFANHNIGRFRLDTTSLPPAVVKLNGSGTPESIRVALATEPAKRTAAQRNELAKFYRENTDNPVTRATSDATAARKNLADFKATLPTTMVMKELPQPREAFILKRGEYDKKGDKVERGIPAAFPPLPPGAPMNRLGFAQWLVAPENPLTARVWVNRAWEKFFGTGLVRTSENFGSQSDWPSHPELLDWLATEFVRLKWDMKAMQKAIVMSAAYRQSSKVTPQTMERDPENRLLARGPRFRLPAELIRDQALAASGLLVEKIGGPSVRPYMPEGVWDETSKYGDLRGYKADTGDNLYRRSLYTIWKRTASPPSMTMFDSPTREICTVKRSRTNTPLQALSLLNEVTFVEAARVLAQRMIATAATPEERIAWAFKRVTCRQPSSDEVQVLADGLAKRLAKFQQDAEASKKLISIGAAPADPNANASELAAYVVTANVLLNLDEVVTRE